MCSTLLFIANRRLYAALTVHGDNCRCLCKTKTEIRNRQLAGTTEKDRALLTLLNAFTTNKRLG